MFTRAGLMEKGPEFDMSSLLYGSFLCRRCLELSQDRPVSVLDNERFTVQSLLERGPAPFVLVRLVFFIIFSHFDRCTRQIFFQEVTNIAFKVFV